MVACGRPGTEIAGGSIGWTVPGRMGMAWMGASWTGARNGAVRQPGKPAAQHAARSSNTLVGDRFTSIIVVLGCGFSIRGPGDDKRVTPGLPLSTTYHANVQHVSFFQ